MLKLPNFTLASVRVSLYKNLPDERGYGLDGVRHGEESHRRQTRIDQARLFRPISMIIV